VNARDGGLAIAIETSTRRASVAARFAGRELARELESDRAHASDLIPALDRLVRELGAVPRDLASVFVGTGPGSYTGLRVGLSTALGLARASGAACLGIPSGETLAFGALAPGQELVLLLDARSGEIYHARYRRTADEVEVLDAPRVVRPADVASLVAGTAPIFGDATVADAAKLDAHSRALLRTDVVPSAAHLLELGLRRRARGVTQRLEDVEPLYLRPFAASARRR
jgi:tRNA threonylcarbamoyladenosine biosynthesis protein TsaB